MVIVETIAVATMVCNDLVMPLLLRTARFGARRGAATAAADDLTGLLLGIRRVAIVLLLLLGYLYFRIAGEAYALVSIGLISFAAVAQFAPALLGGMYWKGGTREGALAGLGAGFACWVYTLMLPSIAKSGWMGTDFLSHGPWGIAWLKPEQLFGLTRLDSLTHSLFWSLLANAGLYAAVSLARSPTAREMSQALLFVDALRRPRDADGAQPVFWRGRAHVADLLALAGRFLGHDNAQRLFAEHARRVGAPSVEQMPADARLVQFVETQLAGAHRQRVGAGDDRLRRGGGGAGHRRRDAHTRRGLARGDAAARVFARAGGEVALAGARQRRAACGQRAVEEPGPAEGRLHVVGDARAAHAADVDPRAGRADGRRPAMEAAQRAQFTGIIVAETERLSRLVNQVLDMAKIESGHAEWHNTDVDLRALTETAVQTTRELFRERGAELVLDAPGPLPLLRADPDRLTQVLLNLLSNAAKFVPTKGGRVEVRLTRTPNSLRVEVQDNGAGVPAEQQGLIFEKFRQGGDAAHRPQGTGLGLPISRQIVEHFGGRMWVQSVAGQGACFGFELPLSLATQEAMT